MEVLQELVSTKDGIALLLLLSPTIALAIFGFLYLKSTMHKNPVTLKNSSETIHAIGQGLVLREEYESMLSAMRKEQRVIAAALHEVSERLAHLEGQFEMRNDDRRSKDRRR